jgi:outer membrane protein assembly factor BamB
MVFALATLCPAKVPALKENPAKAASTVAMFGGTPSRNMINTVDKGILDFWQIEKLQGKVVKAKAQNIKWSIRLGNLAYGGPVIAGGRIFVGTNNEKPRDPKVKGDKGIVMCFRESDGKFLWQAVHEKLPGGELNDFPRQGVASTPAVDGDRIYYVSNRCEVVCADAAGDEATGKAKILWTYDMVKEQGVFPCQLANCSPLVVGDHVYVITGNGVDIGKRPPSLPAPKAPSFLALDKKKGTLTWKSNLPGNGILRGQWSNPAAAEIDGKLQIIFPGGDGWIYGLEPKTGDLIWKFNCNPKKATPYKPGGTGQQCFIISTPVVYEKKVYIAVGQEPDDGPGEGHLWCIDPAKKPANKNKDLSPVGDNFDPAAKANKESGLVWHYGGAVIPKPKDDEKEFVFGRTVSTVAIHDGLLYATELGGYLHCLDAKTGEKFWLHDFNQGTWCSPYYVDGKVYVGTDSGDMFVFKHGKKENKPKEIPMGSNLKVPPIAANGVLYVNIGSQLFAIAPAK